MRVWFDGRKIDGSAIDLSKTGINPSAVETAVRAVGDDGAADEDDERDGSLRISCSNPGPLYEYLWHLREGMSLPLLAALAAAARSNGHTAPEDPEIATLRAEIQATEIERVDLRPAQERLAGVGQDEEKVSERVSELRGQVQLLDDRGERAETERCELRQAIARLSELETERIAAEQALERLRSRARAARDERERTLGLEDRIANLAQSARTQLAADVYDEFADALDVVPGEAVPGDGPRTYEGDDLTAALAVARIASVETPLVISCDRFPSADAAAATLDSPIIVL